MQIGVWISLIAYFALMLGIGVYAYRKSTSDSEDYLLGGRNLPPAVAALSAGASDMSGWLLLGLPGALYLSGLVEAWIGIGLFVGALVNWIVVAPRLREQTERYDNALTIPAFLANRFPSKATALRLVSAIIIVVVSGAAETASAPSRSSTTNPSRYAAKTPRFDDDALSAPSAPHRRSSTE